MLTTLQHTVYVKSDTNLSWKMDFESEASYVVMRSYKKLKMRNDKNYRMKMAKKEVTDINRGYFSDQNITKHFKYKYK